MITLSALHSKNVFSGDAISLSSDQCQLLASTEQQNLIACDGRRLVAYSLEEKLTEIGHLSLSEDVVAISVRPEPRWQDVAVITSNGLDKALVVASMDKRTKSIPLKSLADPWKAISWHPNGETLAVASKSSLMLCSLVDGSLQTIGLLPLNAKSSIRLCWGHTDQLLVYTDDGESFIWTWRKVDQGMVGDKVTLPQRQSQKGGGSFPGMPRCLVPGPAGLFLMTFDSQLSLFGPSDINELSSVKESYGGDGDSNILDLRGKINLPTGGGCLFDICQGPSQVPAAFLLDKQELSSAKASKSILVLTNCFSMEVEVDLESNFRPDLITSFSMPDGNRSIVVVGSSTGRMIVEVFEASRAEVKQYSLQPLSIVSLETMLYRQADSSTTGHQLRGLTILSDSSALKLAALYGSKQSNLEKSKPDINFFSTLTKTGIGKTQFSELCLSVYQLPLGERGDTSVVTSNGDKGESPALDAKESIARMISEMEQRLASMLQERLQRIESKLDKLLQNRD